MCVCVSVLYNSSPCKRSTSLLQLYLNSSCDSTAITFKKDGLCFDVLNCYLKSSEMATVSCKNYHKFITERFKKRAVFYFDPCIISCLRSKFQC